MYELHFLCFFSFFLNRSEPKKMNIMSVTLPYVLRAKEDKGRHTCLVLSEICCSIFSTILPNEGLLKGSASQHECMISYLKRHNTAALLLLGTVLLGVYLVNAYHYLVMFFPQEEMLTNYSSDLHFTRGKLWWLHSVSFLDHLIEFRVHRHTRVRTTAYKNRLSVFGLKTVYNTKSI